MTIVTELSYLEFHNTKEKLNPGYYRVIEADGDVSIVSVQANPWNVTWMTEDEYVQLNKELLDSWDVTDTEFNQYVSDVYANNESDSHAFDDSMAAVSEMAAEKTLGQLLREHMASHPS